VLDSAQARPKSRRRFYYHCHRSSGKILIVIEVLQVLCHRLSHDDRKFFRLTRVLHVNTYTTNTYSAAQNESVAGFDSLETIVDEVTGWLFPFGIPSIVQSDLAVHQLFANVFQCRESSSRSYQYWYRFRHDVRRNSTESLY
jgi:hypothetical protein